MLKLFNVTTTIEEFDGCKDVRVTWFMTDRRHAVAPYAELIRDYEHLDTENGDRQYAEGRVDEFFTQGEANALVAYLDQHHRVGCTHSVNAVALPIEPYAFVGLRAIPIGGPIRHYMLCEEDTWNLALNIYGFYDRRAFRPMEAPDARTGTRRTDRTGQLAQGG